MNLVQELIRDLVPEQEYKKNRIIKKFKQTQRNYGNI